MGRTACTEPQCSRAIPLLLLWAVRPVQNLSTCTVELYPYSPYGPYGLYSRAIPLLPLWAVRPVQSLSAVELYLYSSYGPYGLYRASVPVQGCTLPYSFLLETESTPGPSAAGRLMSTKNSNIVGNRARDLPACSAVPQTTAPPLKSKVENVQNCS
jgi:hypothetical protein